MKNRSLSQEKMNMTPMIDVVFLLVIFFMMVTDITQQELEDVSLPDADMAQKDENPPEKRLVININKQGQYIVKRNNLGAVEQCLDRIRAQLMGKAQASPKNPEGFSEQPVLFRADEETRFHLIQKVLQICSEKPIGIYKAELACRKTPVK